MRELQFNPLPNNLAEAVIVTAGTTDAGQWQKVVPRPMPADHVVIGEWFTNPQGVECLRFKTVHRESLGAKPSPVATSQERVQELMKLPNVELEDMAPPLGVTTAHDMLGQKGGKLRLCTELAKREGEKK
jgi:hypothetical protein